MRFCKTVKKVCLTIIVFLQTICNKGKCKMMSDEEEEYIFPKTLEEFGYHFNEDGQLRNIENGNGYNFVEKENNHRYNQKRYEAIGNIITEYIYELLEKEGLKRVTIPIDAEDDEPTSFFFQSKDAQSNTDKLMVLIHGSGPVKAGQWARRLIMNDCLDSGTQLPFIKWGKENGYGVIVANTNINSVVIDGEKKKIRGSESPEDHMVYLWENFIQPSQAKDIVIVAHSYGGVSVLNLVNLYLEEFQKRVFAVALTDSVHSFQHQDGGVDVIKYYQKRAINWASAYDPLDTVLKTTLDFTPTLSAGTDKHECTSYSCMPSIFKWFTEKYAERTSNPDDLDVKGNDINMKSPEREPQEEDIPMSQGTDIDLESQGTNDAEENTAVSQDEKTEEKSSETNEENVPKTQTEIINPEKQPDSTLTSNDLPVSKENTKGDNPDKVEL